MEKFLEIWAIAWPIIKAVFDPMGFLDMLWIGLFWLVCQTVVLIGMSLLKKIFKILFHRGSLIGEIFLMSWDFLIIGVPIFLTVRKLSIDHPILAELLSYIGGLFGIWETILHWAMVYAFCVLFIALERWLIHRISMLLQKIFFGSYFLTSIVRIAEALLFMVTGVLLPFLFILGINSYEEKPLATQSAVSMPQDVNPEVWNIILKGTSKAQANGVACDPNLVYSLKLYETGTTICTTADENRPRPNNCASSAGALGFMQFLPETFQRNAGRYNVSGSLWNPEVAVEVTCYFISDEVKISQDQTRAEFIAEFASRGFVWNADPSGAGMVYDRAQNLKKSAVVNPQTDSISVSSTNGYIWPAPAGSYVTFGWGVPMWYKDANGNSVKHNGIDIAMSGFPPFIAYAIDDGTAMYWTKDFDTCNAGIINFRTSNGEEFQYVHMELDESKVFMEKGKWTTFEKGDALGWILNGKTSCSDGPHLHIMRIAGTSISQELFNRP